MKEEQQHAYRTLLVAVGLLAGITTVSATTASYYDKGYDFASLKTFDFKTQRRISQDPVDGQTNQLVWRGFNTDTINLKKPEHDFKDAVNDVLSKFFKEAKEQRT